MTLTATHHEAVSMLIAGGTSGHLTPDVIDVLTEAAARTLLDLADATSPTAVVTRLRDSSVADVADLLGVAHANSMILRDLAALPWPLAVDIAGPPTPVSGVAFTGTVSDPAPHPDGTIAVLGHPELGLTVVFPHGTDPSLTRAGATVAVTADGDMRTVYARTVAAV